ncbi:hypothetical protein E2C01_061032 [Portunus trituberculatus]|uniref:Uncharacterized protein n=1 Tax=Portunus trituberculatus TaxID=210409 RepID=A0A5B7HD99_PORTR|nr:hypothetical protein [Portunus trituberculatus]
MRASTMSRMPMTLPVVATRMVWMSRIEVSPLSGSEENKSQTKNTSCNTSTTLAASSQHPSPHHLCIGEGVDTQAEGEESSSLCPPGSYDDSKDVSLVWVGNSKLDHKLTSKNHEK